MNEEIKNLLFECYINFQIIRNDLTKQSYNLITDTIAKLIQILPKEEMDKYNQVLEEMGFKKDNGVYKKI